LPMLQHSPQWGVPQPRGSRTRIDPWQLIDLPLRGAYGRDYRNAVEQRKDWTSKPPASLTGAVADAVRRRHERVPRRAITGPTLRATHSWRAAQGRIKQDHQHDGTDADPRAANQHGHNYQKAPLPLGQPPPALPHTLSTCDSDHRHHSVPIHDPSAELPLTTVHVSALPFRCCSTHRRV